MIVSRTPFRISFFGGGTDYPSWYREHGGAVLATTIDKYCYLTCRYLPPFFEHRYRLVYSKIENCHTIEAITHPAAREVLRFMQMDRGVEIHHDGDLPARSGMGSSSAFTVGLVHALYALKGRMPSKHQLAMESIRIEQEMVKETVGSQDQVMAAYGGLSQVSFHANGEITVRPLALAYDRIRELNANLMLFYTGIKRTAAEVANSYVHQIGDKKKQLHRLREMVDESIAILNNGDDLTAFGELLHESWQAKRSLSAHVTNSDVNDIYEAARAAGLRLQHGRFDLEKPARVEKIADRGDNAAALDEHVAHMRVGDQIDVTLAVTDVHVLEAVPFFRQAHERLGQEREFFHPQAFLPHLGSKKLAFRGNDIADIQQTERRPKLTEHGFLEEKLKPARAVHDIAKKDLAVIAQGHEAPGHMRGLVLSERLEHRPDRLNT